MSGGENVQDKPLLFSRMNLSLPYKVKRSSNYNMILESVRIGYYE